MTHIVDINKIRKIFDRVNKDLVKEIIYCKGYFTKDDLEILKLYWQNRYHGKLIKTHSNVWDKIEFESEKHYIMFLLKL